MKKQENMEFIEQSIPGVFVIEPKKFGDARGYFMETYRQDLFEQHVSISCRITSRVLPTAFYGDCIFKKANSPKQNW